MSKDKSYQTGYGKPPKSGQFQKGQSGNPGGRPKKKKEAKPKYHPAASPTRQIIRTEALRPVQVNEGGRQTEMTSVEAMVKALKITGMKGGVLAQRSYINLSLEEDERFRAEQKADFDFWYDYKNKAHDELKKARAAGQPDPELAPHPDDIELNFLSLEVEINGPANREEFMNAQKAIKLRDLSFELSYYRNEIQTMAKIQSIEIWGPYFGNYLFANSLLPKRLRRLPSSYDALIKERIFGCRQQWEEDLAVKAEACGISFTQTPKDLEFPYIWTFQELGLEMRDGRIQPRTS